MRMIRNCSIAAALCIAIAFPADATTITFGALAGPDLSPFVSLTESGFTVTNIPGSVAGSVNQQTGLGSLGAPPYLDFFGFGGTIEVSRIGNGIFSVNSFDFLGISVLNRNSASYVVEGFMGGSLVSSDTGLPVFSNVWSTEHSTPGLIDRLRITILDDNAYDGVSFLGSIDNIDLLEHDPVSPVPEPASWAMMIAGFGAVGAGMRRRRRVAPSLI